MLWGINFEGQPQWGQYSALSLNLPPHSGHTINAIAKPSLSKIYIW